MNSFVLKIATPDGSVFDGKAESLLVRTALGDVEILAGHADFLAALGIGRARITVDGQKRLAACSGGFVSVKGGEVSLCCTTFEFAEDIDVNRARAAKERAEADLSSNENNNHAEDRLKTKLARALSRISVWELNK